MNQITDYANYSTIPQWKSDKTSEAFNIAKKDDSVKFVYTTSDEIIVCNIYRQFSSLLEGNIEIFLNGLSFINFVIYFY